MDRFFKRFFIDMYFFSHFGYVPVPFKFLIVPTGDVWVPIFFFYMDYYMMKSET